jgi:hypothetical protein
MYTQVNQYHVILETDPSSSKTRAICTTSTSRVPRRHRRRGGLEHGRLVLGSRGRGAAAASSADTCFEHQRLVSKQHPVGAQSRKQHHDGVGANSTSALSSASIGAPAAPAYCQDRPDRRRRAAHRAPAQPLRRWKFQRQQHGYRRLDARTAERLHAHADAERVAVDRPPGTVPGRHPLLQSRRRLLTRPGSRLPSTRSSPRRKCRPA